MNTVTDRDLGYQAVMRQILTGAPGVSVLVGVRDDGTSPPGKPSISQVAAWNEFGTSRIPERSFLRSTVDENVPKYVKLLGDAAAQVLDGVPSLIAFGRVGLRAVGDVQRKIRSRVPPPNAPSTIKKKGSSTPLVDTGRLRQSIEYTVEGAR